STDTEVTFVPSVDAAGTLARTYTTEPPARTNIDLVGGFESAGNRSKLGIAVFVATPDGPAQRQELFPTETGISRSYAAKLKSGEAFRFRTIAAMVSELYHPEPPLEAIRLASWGGMLGFEELRSASRAAWSDLWQSRVKITGDTDAQRVVDCAFFYLH